MKYLYQRKQVCTSSRYWVILNYSIINLTVLVILKSFMCNDPCEDVEKGGLEFQGSRSPLFSKI